MHNPSTIFLIAFFLCFQLCFSLSDLQLIPLDSAQVHTLSTDSQLKFKILNSLSPSVGSFNITVAPVSDQRSAFVVLTREKCAGEPGTSELSFEQLSYRQELSVISFVANTSDDHCFHLEFVRNTQHSAINYSIKVTFTPIQPVLVAEIPYSTYLQENTSQEFAYNYKDHPVEIVRITLKNSQGSAEKTSNALFPQLSQIRGNCLESTSEISWLCYLYNQQGFLKFSLYNPNKTEFYEILISDVTPEPIAADAETTVKYSISGFGSIFKTCLPLIGILKVNAKTVNDKVLAMTGASSLYNLFGALTSEMDGFGQPEAASNNAQGLILQNKQVNTAWYYFVEEEQGEDSFFLSSYFIRQVPLDVGIKATYMIDPELYGYQHIDLKLGNRDFPEKYEVSVWSEGNEGMMNLYFDTNSYDIGYALFPDEQLYRKRASPAATNGELFLSFIVGAHDTSAYLSIHALKKGMYSIQATRVETRSVWEGIFIVALISCMVAYLFSCLAKIFTMSKSNEFDDFSEWPEIPRDNVPANHAPETPNEQDIEADLAEIQSSVAALNENEIYSTRQLLPGLKTMVKKLKRQERLERKIKNQNKKQAENEEEKENNNDHVVLEISEADTCDICYEAKKTVTFGPCGHQCTCAFCALIIVKTSAKCPLCRANINKVQVNQDIQNELKKIENKEKNEKDDKEGKEGENDRQD